MILPLPDFFVPGAQKAGTTSLHDRLVSHPEVCLPKLKETQFFSNEERFALGLDWYRAQFSEYRTAQIVGEICPDYLYFPASAERIRTLIKKPKLIFIFRHPLRRAYSHYLMSVRQGFEQLDFVEALTAEEERLATTPSALLYHAYLARGAYSGQLQRYLRLFPEARFLFLKFEDLTDAGPVGIKTFLDICEFLGIARMDPDTEIHSNPASQPRSEWLRNWLYQRNRLKSGLGLFLSKPTKERIAVTLDRWNQRKINPSEAPKVPDHFVHRVQNEIQQLQSLTGLDLSDWMKQDKAPR